MEEVLYIKLVTGEEIVAEVISNDEYMTINNPLQIHVQNTNRGAGVSFTKWIPHVAVDSFKIRWSHVIVLSHIDDELREFYSMCINAIIARQATEEEDVRESRVLH